ncbi:hypothetical protein HSX11_13510 [Oxalobacteraceae bacterium]|nr:hypothetical protein [Oxalobacteraceae bacterium]
MSTRTGEFITLNIPGGQYQRYVVDNTNNGKPVELMARLSEPRGNTQWTPLMLFCAQGSRLGQESCLWFQTLPDGVGGYITPYNGVDRTELQRNMLASGFQVDRAMRLVMKLEPRGYSMAVDGMVIYSKKTDFDVMGYSFGCSSAVCEFNFTN